MSSVLSMYCTIVADSAASPATAAPGAIGVAAAIVTEASGGGEKDDFDDWELDTSAWQDIADEIEIAGPGIFLIDDLATINFGSGETVYASCSFQLSLCMPMATVNF